LKINGLGDTPSPPIEYLKINKGMDLGNSIPENKALILKDHDFIGVIP
jgi:hypothetical protein